MRKFYPVFSLDYFSQFHIINGPSFGVAFLLYRYSATHCDLNSLITLLTSFLLILVNRWIFLPLMPDR